MRIVVVSWKDTTHPQAGGCELLVDRLLSGLQAKGHDVALVAGGPVGSHEYPVANAGGTYDQYLRAPFVCARRFPNTDLVIDVENGVPFFSPIWRRGPSICLVLHNHRDQWIERFPAPVARVARVVEDRITPGLYRNRLFVAISQSTAQSLEHIGVASDHIRVIEPGVDLPASAPTAKSATPLFVALTRLVPHKRLDLLLQAWSKVEPSTGGRFVIIGTGPELGRLRAMAAEIPGCEVAGWVASEEKERLLGEAWLLVHGAEREGWGIVVMEAAATGTPTLALDAPGVRDSVVHGVTGVIVDAARESLVAALAQSWIDLAMDRQRRERFGAAARTHAEKYSWEAMTDAWERVAEEAVTRPEDSSPKRKPRQSLRQPPAPVARGTASATEALTHPDIHAGGLRRMGALLRGFRTQFDDPDGFYSLLAADTVQLIERYEALEGASILDVGGGSGYFAEAFRGASASSAFIEPEWEEITPLGRELGFGIVGDGCRLPIADGAFDISFSSNVLEHVPEPTLFLKELLRVVRPGGLVFLAFTNWLSPFGGHETSPWHYIGGKRAAERYERRLGYPPKNRFGHSLFKLSISDVLRWTRKESGFRLIDAFPRYYPPWTKPVLRLPVVREVLTWNLVIVLRKDQPDSR